MLRDISGGDSFEVLGEFLSLPIDMDKKKQDKKLPSSATCVVFQVIFYFLLWDSSPFNPPFGEYFHFLQPP